MAENFTVVQLKAMLKKHKGKNCKPISSMRKQQLYSYAAEIGLVKPQYKALDLLADPPARRRKK